MTTSNPRPNRYRVSWLTDLKYRLQDFYLNLPESAAAFAQRNWLAIAIMLAMLGLVMWGWGVIIRAGQ